MSSEPESFLARWSRRKRASGQEAAPPAQEAAPPLAGGVPGTVGAEGIGGGGTVPASTPANEAGDAVENLLPPIESLDGLRSDYTEFFKQPVGEDLRRAALKKLFSDPHFNQMDMLDVYVDDYTQFEPLPAAMRMRLPSARAFLQGPELAAVEAAEAAAAAGDAPGPAPVSTADINDRASSPGDVDEAGGLADDDANADSRLALTESPGHVPAPTVSAQDVSVQTPLKDLNVTSSTSTPPDAAAPDPSSSSS